jgi:predicted RNA-binding protein with PIN domain
MHTLIDGYNLMHTLGLLDKRFGPDGFRKARIRFLSELAGGLGPVEASRTTVVFDAREAPGHLPRESTHKGMAVIYADEDEGADERIERLIAAHSVPKALTVVSTDRRIRQAASRRKARALTAEAFWEQLESSRGNRVAPPPPSTKAEDEARQHGPGPEDAAAWLETFQDVALDPDTPESLGQGGFIPTDDEINRIAREVDEEFRNRG